MSFSAIAVANVFIDLAKESDNSLSNMQLQKLVYIAHGFSLALLDKALIYNDVKAWQYGPVYPKLYKKLRKYGAGKVVDFLDCDEKLANDNEFMEVIRGVWKAYGKMSGGELSARTHSPKTPWSQCWEKEPYSNISDELIQNYYKNILSK